MCFITLFGFHLQYSRFIVIFRIVWFENFLLTYAYYLTTVKSLYEDQYKQFIGSDGVKPESLFNIYCITTCVL